MDEKRALLDATLRMISEDLAFDVFPIRFPQS